jgi:alpha-methylacyl-CoA racemase
MTLLNSLKIIDFTGLLPGPYATMTLADLGAEVLKVESPNKSDLIRTVPPMDDEYSVIHS